MTQSQRLLSPMSQRCGCSNGVLNLPTINIPHREFPNLLRGERHTDLGQERIPNLRLGTRIEIIEVKSDVNPRAEGIIDYLDSVSREEENTSIIFKVTKAGY